MRSLRRRGRPGHLSCRVSRTPSRRRPRIERRIGRRIDRRRSRMRRPSWTRCRTRPGHLDRRGGRGHHGGAGVARRNRHPFRHPPSHGKPSHGKPSHGKPSHGKPSHGKRSHGVRRRLRAPHSRRSEAGRARSGWQRDGLARCRRCPCRRRAGRRHLGPISLTCEAPASPSSWGLCARALARGHESSRVRRRSSSPDADRRARASRQRRAPTAGQWEPPRRPWLLLFWSQACGPALRRFS